MLSSLYGEMSAQYIIFGANKDKNIVVKSVSLTKHILEKDQNLSKLKDKYSLEYSIASFGDYYAIKTSPIDNYELKEMLILSLRADFPNLVSIDVSQKDQFKHEKYYTVTAEHRSDASTTIINSIDKDQIKQYVKKTHHWLEKWHALIVLLLLGGFFYYRRKHQISDIKLQQQDLLNEQNAIEVKIKNI